MENVERGPNNIMPVCKVIKKKTPVLNVKFTFAFGRHVRWLRFIIQYGGKKTKYIKSQRTF